MESANIILTVSLFIALCPETLLLRGRICRHEKRKSELSGEKKRRERERKPRNAKIIPYNIKL